MELVTLPSVFRPIADTWMLADAVERRVTDRPSTVLELCAGSGAVAIRAASVGARVTAVDVSRRALWTIQFNARRHGVTVRTRRGDLFGPVAGERFDVVAVNPPYVPSPADRLPRRGASRAWEAGPTGRTVIDAIISTVRPHLTDGGTVLLVHSDLVGRAETLEALAGVGLAAPRVVARCRGPLGPLMRAQQATGLVSPEVDEEDLLVFAATEPG